MFDLRFPFMCIFVWEFCILELLFIRNFSMIEISFGIFTILPVIFPAVVFFFFFILTSLFSSAYWIAFGAHGPRSPVSPKGEGLKIFAKVLQLLLASFALVAVIRYFAKPAPRTLSKEWQEASNEYAKVSGVNEFCRPSIREIHIR